MGKNGLLPGTLDMMVLRTLVTGDAHGHTIAKVIERTSEDVLEVDGTVVPVPVKHIGRDPIA